MNGQRAVALALLACSVLAVGTMSASLDAAITQGPDEAIDVDTDSLPFMGDGASEVADSYREGEEANEQAEVQSGSDESSSRAAGDPSDAEQRAGGAGSSQAARGGSDGDGSAGGAGADGSDADGGTGPAEGDGLEESLWALLEQLLAAVLAIAALLALLAGGRYLYRRRHRLLARLRALALRYGLISADGDPVRRPVMPPDDADLGPIERAWNEMIRASETVPHSSATPRECAQAAVAAGVDRSAAIGLTDLYEQVHYGGRSPTPDQVARAREWASEVTPNRGVGLPDGGVTAGDERTVQDDVPAHDGTSAQNDVTVRDCANDRDGDRPASRGEERGP